MQISQEISCVGVFFNIVPGSRKLYWKDTPTQVFSCEFWELSKNNYFVEDLWTAGSETPARLLSSVAASDSFRFPASNFIKKETPEKMLICEFCNIFKNIFRQKHIRMAASCVYLWILRSFSDHLFYRAPLGNCLFHLQIAQFQPPNTVKKSYVLFKHLY